jgi:hypothetical protein
MGQKKTYFKSALKIKIGQKNPYLKKQLVDRPIGKVLTH